jgi:hypothetical protein
MERWEERNRELAGLGEGLEAMTQSEMLGPRNRGVLGKS